jgi:hypothetical protein
VTARSRERNARHLADHSSQPPAAETFLHRRQHLAILSSLAVDHAIRVQADTEEGRGEEIASAQAPQHGPFRPRRNAGGEEHRDARIGTVGSGLEDFVKRTAGQSTRGKVSTQRRNPKAQHGALCA